MYMYAYIYIYIYTCILFRRHRYPCLICPSDVYVFMRKLNIYIYIYTYVCMYVCMYVCIYIYIYIYTHTYMYPCLIRLSEASVLAAVPGAFKAIGQSYYYCYYY